MYANDVSETFDCRICGGSQISKDNLLIQPCLCTGGLSLVHAKCLMKWIELRPDCHRDSGRFVCEICREPYQIKVKTKFKCTLEKTCSWKQLVTLLEVVLLLFCSFCTVLLMFSIINSTKYQEGDSSERITVWSLFGVGILMAMVAMVKIVRRFVLASSTTEIECLNHESVLMAGNNTSVARLSAAVEGDEDGDDGGALII